LQALDEAEPLEVSGLLLPRYGQGFVPILVKMRLNEAALWRAAPFGDMLFNKQNVERFLFPQRVGEPGDLRLSKQEWTFGEFEPWIYSAQSGV
jgi:hypothetical protein